MIAIPEIGGVRVHDISLRRGLTESAVSEALRRAHCLLRRGWVQRLPWCDEGGDMDGVLITRWSLTGAVKSAAESPIVAHYALRVLSKVVGAELNAWNDSPIRTRAEVLNAVEQAIRACGGKVPLRGGWHVTHRRSAV